MVAIKSVKTAGAILTTHSLPIHLRSQIHKNGVVVIAVVARPVGLNKRWWLGRNHSPKSNVLFKHGLATLLGARVVRWEGGLPLQLGNKRRLKLAALRPAFGYDHRLACEVLGRNHSKMVSF
jgi:hypothetical protein